jgi:predicted phosphoribosyltransferase
MSNDKPIFLFDSAAWKQAMQKQLRDRHMTRYEFVRQCVDNKICTMHTAECLLADNGTVTGKRKPSFEIALNMARLAGLETVLVPTPIPIKRKAFK